MNLVEKNAAMWQKNKTSMPLQHYILMKVAGEPFLIYYDWTEDVIYEGKCGLCSKEIDYYRDFERYPNEESRWRSLYMITSFAIQEIQHLYKGYTAEQAARSKNPLVTRIFAQAIKRLKKCLCVDVMICDKCYEQHRLQRNEETLVAWHPEKLSYWEVEDLKKKIANLW